MNYHGHLVWNWIAVVSPILVGHAFIAIRFASMFFECIVLSVRRSQAAVDAFGLRLEKKTSNQFEKTRSAIRALHESLSPKRRSS